MLGRHVVWQHMGLVAQQPWVHVVGRVTMGILGRARGVSGFRVRRIQGEEES